jgi:hypothetical protein
MAIGSQEAVQKRSMGVPAPDDASLGKLRLVMGLFRLRPCDLQRTGYSKAYISGVLAGKVKASAQYWMKLNSVLPKIINEIGSACCVFEVEPVPMPEMSEQPEVLRKAS